MSSTLAEPIDVLVVGAGPVGLMLAGELALAGVRPVVVERLPERSPVPKANGLVGQVVRLMDHRGLYQRLTGSTQPPVPTPMFMFGGMPLPLDGWADSPMFALPVPQWDLEVSLEARARELGVDIRRGQEVVGFTQDADGVTVDLAGARLRARFVVGCDGGHSLVRKHAGIDFAGSSSERLTSRSAHVVLPDSVLTAEGELDVPGAGRFRPVTFYRTDTGVFVFASFQPGVHLVTAMEWDQPVVSDDEPVTFDEIRAAVGRVVGADVPMSPPTRPGRYVLRRLAGRNTRLATSYRAGRVLLAGDAAHVHSAVGGPGLNLGLQDVANLGWKLAAEIHGWAPAGLLDTYHGERHPVGERVMLHTQAQSALLAPGGEVTALRAVFGELLADPANVRRIAAMMAGADVQYQTGDHPLVGRWVVDFPLTVAGRATRLAEVARSARPLLLDLAGSAAVAAAVAGWADRVDLVVASAPSAPASAILVRPDGYAAWAGDDVASLVQALRTWFGEPA